MPESKVEVAVEVTEREPPEITMPEDVVMPAATSPPLKVEVAVEVTRSEPPVRASPPEPIPIEEKVAPPVKLEVAAPVTAMSGVMTLEVAMKPEADVVPVTETAPETAKVVPGVVVPIPTLPEVFSITNLSPFTAIPPTKVEVD